VRSVLSTLFLLLAAVYVFGIVFREQLHGRPEVEGKFDTVTDSMWFLLLQGALADEITEIAEKIKDASNLMTVLFGVFVLTSHITLLNMLVGVLVEVVSQVSSAHKERTDIRLIKDALTDVITSMDSDDDGTITRSEYENLVEKISKMDASHSMGATQRARLRTLRRNDPEVLLQVAVDALESLGIDEVDLERMADELFADAPEDEETESELQVDKFIKIFCAKCIEMRETVSRKDLVEMQKSMKLQFKALYKHMRITIAEGGEFDHLDSLMPDLETPYMHFGHAAPAAPSNGPDGVGDHDPAADHPLNTQVAAPKGPSPRATGAVSSGRITSSGRPPLRRNTSSGELNSVLKNVLEGQRLLLEKVDRMEHHLNALTGPPPPPEPPPPGSFD
jgi:hypothetical protein